MKTARVYSLGTPRPARPLARPLNASGVLVGIAYRPDGGALAVVGGDRLATLTLWNPGYTRQDRVADPDPGILDKAAYFPNGGPLATVGSDGKLRLRNPDTGRGSSGRSPGRRRRGWARSPCGRTAA